MSKRYCFRILNSSDEEFDIGELLEFISKLYIDNSDEKDKLSFFPYYSKGINDDNVCIEMKGKGEAMIKKIEQINKMLGENPSMLKWSTGISLSPPYEYDDTQGQGFPLKLEKTKGTKRWSSIVQRGPYFKEIMEPYVHLNASLSINGKIYNLEPEEEKVAGFYATRIRADAKDTAKTQYTKLEQFNKNFWKDFKEYLTPKAKSIFKSYNDFLQIDWSDLIEKLEQKTLAEKELAKTKEEKVRKKQKTAQIRSEYGYAILDGKPRQKIAPYQVEMSGIFIGKKGHPKLGSIKKQIMPEDVTINKGENDPKPTPPFGHRWGKVVNDYTKVWLASWKDEINNKIKYIWFSPEGVFKAQSDFNKYEKARKLHFQIEKIRTNYMKLAESSNMIKKQIGTVLFLIDRFGIRIGNETDSDISDPVVGATTLLVSNINVDKKNIVIFDFEGKDRVRFYKELEVPEKIYKNFKELKEEGKKGHNQIFDQISSDTVNTYLKDIDPDFTAKVFRTRLASEIMYNALQELPSIAPKSTNTHIKKEFNKANIKVAEVLNHVRTAGQNKSMETLKNSLKEAEKKGDKKTINKLTEQIEEKQVLMSVAINTSLVNYIDPRIVASWAKNQNVSINSVYNSTLQSKFKWAINLINSKDDEWSWKESDLEEGEEENEEEENEEENEEEGEEESEEETKKSRTRRSVIMETARRPPKKSQSETVKHPPDKAQSETVKHPPKKSQSETVKHPPDKAQSETVKHLPKKSQSETVKHPPDKAQSETVKHPPKKSQSETVKHPPDKVEETPDKVEETPHKVEETPDKVEETPHKVEETPHKVEETPEIKSRKRYKKITPRPNWKEETKMERENKKVSMERFPLKMLESYRLLLQLCKDLKKGKDLSCMVIISKINPAVLKWIYTLSKNALDNGIIKIGSIYYKPNKYIINYCEKEIFNKESTPVHSYPTSDTSSDITTPSLPPRSRTPLFSSSSDSTSSPISPYPKTPFQTPSSDTYLPLSQSKSDKDFERNIRKSYGSSFPPKSRTPIFSSFSDSTATPTPPPKKEKQNYDIYILKTGVILLTMKGLKSIEYKKIDKELADRFSYLNSYTNEKDLSTYCKNNGIECKGKNKKEMKETIIEFFKDRKNPPII
jgi:DNA topoisomerase-1